LSLRGIGTDIVAVARIASLVERHGDRFLARCFRPGELAVLRERVPAAAHAALAARWAAKEAFVKALAGRGTGVVYRDIEVVRRPDGAPELRLHGSAAAALAAAGAGGTLVSLSHERDYAAATVVLL
jgi:holo-[acyl-carrier protein] synthase